MKLFSIITYQLYLLQLESYDLGRYSQSVFRTWGKSGKGARKKLQWTLKAQGILVVAILWQVILAAWFMSGFLAYIGFLLSFLIFPLFLGMATISLWPVDWALKQIYIKLARKKLQEYPSLKVIGITGSYGKTTMKEVLSSVLSAGMNVLKTPDSVNTPLGVARLILKNLDSKVHILIIEMGAFQKGDIQALCALARPDVAILTGINEAHLERFGSLENTIATKFEIVKYSSLQASVILNGDDLLVMQNFDSYVGSRSVYVYQSNPPPGSDWEILEKSFSPEGKGFSFRLKHDKQDSELLQVPVLGSYIFGDIIASVHVAKELGMINELIFEGISQITAVPHRLQMLTNPRGILVIDDSYNGNPKGVYEAVSVLEKFRKQRKIYLTPGLVEMGSRTQEIHYTIGKQLALAADLVLLIKNSVTPFLAEGLTSAGFPLESIMWFKSAEDAHSQLGNLLQPGDVILFQNDWPDNYL